LEFPSFDNLQFPTLNRNLQTKFLHGGVLLSPFLDTLVIEKILPQLLVTSPFMFWWFRQINKGSFTIINETMVWNTLEIIKTNHLSYLQLISHKRFHGIV
jgi:hypothetical protein